MYLYKSTNTDAAHLQLCKKDLEALKHAMIEEEKDVKRSPGFKLSALYIATMDKVKSMLESKGQEYARIKHTSENGRVEYPRNRSD